jgi:biotin transport system substrate-specific component
MNEGSRQLRMTVYASLFAALIAAGAFIAIPVGPVPIVLQNFFVLLAGLLLGWRWGLAAVGVYILAGLVGMPVFSAGRAGLGHIAGPTGGYLLSYLPAVVIVGLAVQGFSRLGKTGPKAQLTVDIVAGLAGSTVVYAAGVPWLKAVTGVPWPQAVGIGLLPFLPGDMVKVVAAAVVARYGRLLMPS